MSLPRVDRLSTNPRVLGHHMSKGGHVVRREPRIQNIKRENISFGKKDLPFPDFFSIEREIEGGREGGRFPSSIHGISSVKIRRAKN